MKNKLYMSLFAVAVSGSVTVSATGPDGHGFDRVWGGPNSFSGGILDRTNTLKETNDVPNWQKIVEQDKPGTLGATYNPSPRLGASPLTYAPSQEENFLRHLAGRLNSDDALQLQNIANAIGQLRMNYYEVFKECFGSESHHAVGDMAPPAPFEKAAMPMAELAARSEIEEKAPEAEEAMPMAEQKAPEAEEKAAIEESDEDIAPIEDND